MEDDELKAIEDELDEETLKAMDAALAEIEAEKSQELTPEKILADYITQKTRQEKLVAYSVVTLSPPDGLSREQVKDLLKNVESLAAFAPIASIDGKKDTYFYDTNLMTNRFATVQSLIEDKDILSTIATTARHDCKIYPRPLRMATLLDSPYFFTEDEVLGALARMKLSHTYEDIDTVTASNGKICIYSSLYMKEKYARALCEEMEVEWKHNL